MMSMKSTRRMAGTVMEGAVPNHRPRQKTLNPTSLGHAISTGQLPPHLTPTRKTLTNEPQTGADNVTQ
jgi:hypothetical protein